LLYICSVKHIKLSNRENSILVDDEDYDRLIKFKWSINTGLTCISRTEYFPGIPFKIKARIKKFVLANEVMKDYESKYDHIDRNPLNNQKANLRKCTFSQNGMNRSKAKNTSSAFKGVSWNNAHKKWVARIMISYKRIHLGEFDEEEKAAQAYDQAATLHFGEFAVLNFKELPKT
jgi:hypothetical protein